MLRVQIWMGCMVNPPKLYKHHLSLWLNTTEYKMAFHIITDPNIGVLSRPLLLMMIITSFCSLLLSFVLSKDIVYLFIYSFMYVFIYLFTRTVVIVKRSNHQQTARYNQHFRWGNDDLMITSDGLLPARTGMQGTIKSCWLNIRVIPTKNRI
jgi:hypothetical protein